MNESERMAQTRRAATSTEAMHLAFGGGAPFPREASGQEQQQHPESPAAPLPSAGAMSAGAARVLELASSNPQALAAEVEALALASLKAENRAAKLEEELASLKNTPAAQLARFKATGSL